MMTLGVVSLGVSLMSLVRLVRSLQRDVSRTITAAEAAVLETETSSCPPVDFCEAVIVVHPCETAVIAWNHSKPGQDGPAML